jgi:hypothetical protein
MSNKKNNRIKKYRRGVDQFAEAFAVVAGVIGAVADFSDAVSRIQDPPREEIEEAEAVVISSQVKGKK